MSSFLTQKHEKITFFAFFRCPQKVSNFAKCTKCAQKCTLCTINAHSFWGRFIGSYRVCRFLVFFKNLKCTKKRVFGSFLGVKIWPFFGSFLGHFFDLFFDHFSGFGNVGPPKNRVQNRILRFLAIFSCFLTF